MFAFINGMAIHPKNAPIHQTGTLFPNARKKFSVLIASRRELQIIRTRLLGDGISDTSMLPPTIARPDTALTIPSADSLPELLDRTIAGSAASKTEAVKFIAAKNSMRSKIPRLCLRYRIPLLADSSTDSALAFSVDITFGIFTKNSSDKKAIPNVNKQTQ